MQIEVSVDEASELISKFVRENGIRILNVAGPRASEWVEGYDYAISVLDLFLGCSGGLASERSDSATKAL